MAPSALPPYTPWLNRGFGRFLKRYFRRHFDAVRVVKGSVPRVQGPFIVCANHPAWWDPITLLLLAHHYFPDHRCYGPIDAQALARYPTLGRLGLLPLDKHSLTSRRQFLDLTDEIMAQGHALGITAQGEFVDVRNRPLRLESGIAHLMRRHPQVPVIPLAMEYPFWNEKSPQVLIHFGRPLSAGDHRANRTLKSLRGEAESALTETMDQLGGLSQLRDPDSFETIIHGSQGVGGWYDLGRRVKSWSRGQRFDPAHDVTDREGQ